MPPRRTSATLPHTKRLLPMAAGLLGLGTLALAGDTPCPVGTPVGSYRCCPIDNVYVSILGAPGTVVAHAPPVDDATVAVPFSPGFAFSFFGVPKAVVSISTNGIADFIAPGSPSFLTAHPGDEALPNDCVMPWHDDLILTPAAGSIVAYNFGFPPYGAPNLTIQWTEMATWTGPGTGAGSISFQAVLYGTGHPLAGMVDFKYDRTDPAPIMAPCAVAPAGTSTYATSATVGLESAPGPTGEVIGVEATDRGAGNFSIPPCDIRFTPATFTGAEGDQSASMVLEPQEPFCTIVGLPGTFSVGPNCTGLPCQDDQHSSLGSGVEIFLPFFWKFNLLGRLFQTYTLSPNGFLNFGPGQWSVTGVPNALLPGTPETEATLAPFWDSLEGTLPGPGVFYRTDGLPGCRVLTIEWSHFGAFVPPGRDCVAAGDISFQIKLFEGSAGMLLPSLPPCPYDLVAPGIGNDRIEFHYAMTNVVAPFSATIGYENHKGTIGASLSSSPVLAAPPTLPGGVPAKVVIDTCDFGVFRTYGFPTDPPGPPFCIPEILANCVPPRIGNPFGLRMTGVAPGVPGFFAIDFGGAMPGTRTPVPCGGLPFPSVGTLWVFPPTVFLFPCGVTTTGPGPCEGGCCLAATIPPDPALVGFTVFVQGVAVPAGAPPLQLTQGAKVTIGA